LAARDVDTSAVHDEHASRDGVASSAAAADPVAKGTSDLGDGVHLSEAFINHSCEPNCELQSLYHES
tara:strand:- start:156 stop:356 length:201 start_codon:yes stop_codon:yes gene_type:complete